MVSLKVAALTVELSADNRRGGMLYKFDVSLMERLASQGFPMSQLQVQRRMRPEASALIRCVSVLYWLTDRGSLYPALQDHEIVQTQRPDVAGMAKNVFFL